MMMLRERTRGAGVTYDKEKLKTWAEMERWDECLERNGALNKLSSKEGFDHVQKEYFSLLDERIRCCKELLKEHDDACIYFTLAELYDRQNLDEKPDLLFKRSVRRYCLESIRRKPDYAPQWVLLAKAYAWIAELGGESDEMPELEMSFWEDGIQVRIERGDGKPQETLRWIEMAIQCMKKAISIDPDEMGVSQILEESLSHKKRSV
ncbi:MAG: hypothetical protein WC484_04900 [Candidatus Omnitrophota bacterium]